MAGAGVPSSATCCGGIRLSRSCIGFGGCVDERLLCLLLFLLTLQLFSEFLNLQLLRRERIFQGLYVGSGDGRWSGSCSRRRRVFSGGGIRRHLGLCPSTSRQSGERESG